MSVEHDNTGIRRGLSPARRAVLASAVMLAAAWAAQAMPRLAAGQNALIRIGLPAFFAAALALRAKRGPSRPLPRLLVPLAAGLGLPAAALGAAFGAHQMEWTGVLLMLFACLAWALPPACAPDAARALFLLYWAHPLPGRVFGAMELGLQSASVRGAEWLLQSFNVRVWADGLILRTGRAAFEVPAWCSGMRAAAAMFLMGLGLGMLKRLGPLPAALLTALAPAQALALNVLRIAAAIALAPLFRGASGTGFLHATTGMIVLLGAALLYAEAAQWKRRRGAPRREPDLDLFRRLSEHPPLWRLAIRFRRAILALLLLALLAAAPAFRGRPARRAALLRDVALNLQSAGRLEAAGRLAGIVLDMRPRDHDWHMTVVRIALDRGLHDRVLAELDRVPDGEADRPTEKNVLRAYALMALNRLDEAGGVIALLPRRMRDEDPRVAMVLARLALAADDPDEVGCRARRAADYAPNVGRIRALYPYLRRHRQWSAIAASDRRLPYDAPDEAFAAAEAHMNLNDAPAVARLTLDALARWPDDPRLLEPLFFMAMKRTDSAWEDRFAAHLARSAPRVGDPDRLAGMIGKCFQLGRPDLAWLLYRRIAAVDPAHPYLALLPARHGAEWFTFRKRRLGMSAPLAGERIDTRPFFLIAGQLDAWRPLAASVPRGDELGVADPGPARERLLDVALTEFAARDRAGRLSTGMRYAYAGALEMKGDIASAEAQLNAIAAADAGERARVRTALSEVYERQGDWENVYEIMRTYPNTGDPELMALVRLARACTILRLPLAARRAAELCVRRYPDSSQAVAALAGVLLSFGAPAEALPALSRPLPRRQREMDVLEAEALFDSGRLAEAENFRRAAGLPRIPVPADAVQAPDLPPAELSAAWHRALAFADGEAAAHAARARAVLETARSAFLRLLLRQWLRAYEAECAGDTAATGAWTACGRDAAEKATALSQLALLLCRQRRFDEARRAIEEAVGIMPDAPSLWRMLVSLSGADPAVVDAARRACPRDPELWLADIVLLARNPGALDAGEVREAIGAEIRSAAAQRAFPAETFTRAGDYLLRGGMTGLAREAAACAVADARGLLPAYVLGIRCALALRDTRRALECTRLAINASLRPSPALYAELVALKSSDGRAVTDAEMVEALKALRREAPDDPLWAQMLGYARFRRGGPEVIDALRHMNAAIRAGATNRLPYVVAAEAARLRGSPKEAVDLLEAGLRRHPDDLGMLNNLAYTLAGTDAGAAEARRFTAQLLERGADDQAILDTVAVVCLRGGRPAEARAILARLLAEAPPASRRWFVTRLRQAELAFREERFAAALDALRDALENGKDIPDEDILAANELYARAETARIRRTSPSGAPAAAD